ncbi:MAG: S-layer homology domain-containing protein [Cyanobacteria bacterium J06638_28]
MSTPPSQNTPTPRPPRDDEDWIAILLALGILGGLAGWLIFGNSLFLRAGDVRADLSEGINRLRVPLISDSPEDELTTLEDSDLETEADTTRSQPLMAVAEEPDQSSDRLHSASDTGTFRFDEDAEADGLTSDATSDEEVSVEEAEEDLEDTVIVPDPVVPENVTPDTLPAVREALTFSDVEDDFWAKPYIDALTAREVLDGLPDGSYAPNRPVTRAELAAQVAQAFETEPKQAAETFTDIPEDYWALSKIEESVTTGFMSGYPDQVFRPTQNVPRVQVLVTLVSGLDLPPSAAPDKVLAQFPDQADIPAWARGQVAMAAEAGLIIAAPDSGDQLRPNESATRAEVAAILYRGLAFLGQVEPIE